MIITHKITMAVDRRGPDPVVDAVQGDTNTREVLIALTCGGEPWTIPEGVAGLVRFRKPDGSGGIYDTMPDGTSAVSYSENTVRALLAPQVLTVPGCVLAQMELKNGEDVLGTFIFKIMVERDPSIGAMDSQDYINLSQYVSAEVQKILAGKGTNRILLYEYASINSGTFPAGKLTATDMVGEYSGVEVLFYCKRGGSLVSSGFIPKDTLYPNGAVAIGVTDAGELVTRTVKYSGNVFTFGSAMIGTAADNRMMLPWRIYGYK